MRSKLSSLPRRKAEFIEPMECASVSKLPDGSQWVFEIKLDGYRAIGVKTSRETILYSRNHKNFNNRFPQIAEALDDLPADTVIDGEVVALDESGRPDFHRLELENRHHRIAKKRTLIKLDHPRCLLPVHFCDKNRLPVRPDAERVVMPRSILVPRKH